MTPSTSPISAPASFVTMFIACFVLVVLFAGILQQIGAPIIYVALLLMMFVVSLYVFAGILTKTMRFSTFQTADKVSIPFFNGMAVASGAISGSVFVTYAGYIYTQGTDFLVLYLGILLGIAFLTIFFAASIARSRESTIAGLLFPSGSNRSFAMLAMLIVLLCSFLLLFAQIKLLTLFMGSFYELGDQMSAALIVIVAAACLIMGGMQSLSIVRTLAYPIIALALVIPIAWSSYNITGSPIPQFSFGDGAVSTIMEIDQELLAAELITKEEIFNPVENGREFNGFNLFAALVSLALGISVMPHLLQHFSTLKKGRPARKSGIWAFVLIAFILSLLPAAAMFGKLDFYTALLGLQVGEIAVEASWIFELSAAGKIPLITICGALVSDTKEAIAACGSDEHFLSLSDIGMNAEYLMLSFAMLGDLPSLVTVIIVTGALLAVFSTVDGLLLVMANTLTVDFYHHTLKPKSPPGIRLFMNRFFLGLVAVILLLTVPYVTISIEQLFAAAITLACACLFPALVSRLWFSGLTDLQIGIGMLSALITSTVALTMNFYGPDFILNSGDEVQLNIPGLIENLNPLSFGLPTGLVFFITVFLIGLAGKAGHSTRDKREHSAHA